ncbi:MAG TPA: hypothetical protein VKM72_34980 [Thermoanaerobaculia bacterium]|nr:hypothetical protein [Thermoanaerobaculia bacterium]
MSSFVFDRDGADHPWERALRELAAGPDERRRAVAENWRMDHRVTLERENEDLLACGYFTAHEGAEEWRRALYAYFRLRLCQPSDPSSEPRSSYLHACNTSNLVSGLASFDRLCHVGSLQAIVGRVLAGGAAADAEASLVDELGVSIPEKLPGEAEPLWLGRAVGRFAELLMDRGEAAVRTAARILLEALGPAEPPWWACFAEEVQPQIDTGTAAGLCEALGLGHRWAGEWLIVWSYPVSDAGPLYRPTVAEATDSPFHYPSPPEFGFGITMPLDSAHGTCREVLHRPLRGSAAEAGCTGKLLFLEDFPPMADTRLMELRRIHRDRLRSELGTDALTAWLDRHAEAR